MAAPLVWLHLKAVVAPPLGADLQPGWALWGKSVALAALVAVAAVAAGWVPARMLGSARRGRGVLLVVLMLPLLLPRHLTYYAWSLLLGPGTPLGRWTASSIDLALAARAVTVTATLILWYWPLAALLMSQGWRDLDADVLAEARLDAGRFQRLTRVTGPLMGRSVLLAGGVCFLLAMSEFGSLDLAGTDTVGMQLARALKLAESRWVIDRAAAVARAAWPMAAGAVVGGLAMWKRAADWSERAPVDHPDADITAGAKALLAGLLLLSVVLPVAALAANVADVATFWRYWPVFADKLGWSAAVAVAAGAGAVAMAAGALAIEDLGRPGRALAAVMQVTLLTAALMPGVVLGLAILRLRVAWHVPDGPWVLAAGLAARMAGLALVVLRLLGDRRCRHLAEAASVDGASDWQGWVHVRLARAWPLAAGAFLLVAMLAMTELPVTLVLLGVMPNFAQWLLNEFHYVRDEHVNAACLVLVATYLVAGLGAAALLWAARSVRRLRGPAALLLLAAPIAGLAGCDSDPGTQQPGRVAGCFGRTGTGPGEFVYPRAIDFDAEGNLAVADRTGRIQRMTPAGRAIVTWRMPETEAGYPTGLTFGPDGNWYVPDTHYHRVMVYAPDGRLVRQFGAYGEGDGQFIYPTDVAFAPDGRLFVAEFGGHDRVSIFSADGTFIRAFGKLGSGEGELSRPSALAVDAARGRLYVADGCNHRIAVYDLDGRLQRYVGSVGSGAGELRYPRDLALLPDGRLVVCEFGNNRVQVFTPDGRSEALYGGPGRELGQLAYPWAVAVDGEGRAYIVDSGNSRIQIWRL